MKSFLPDFRSHWLELLFADLIIIFLMGFPAYAFNDSVSEIVLNFGQLCGELGLISIFYLIGFLIWGTYKSFSNNIKANDLHRSFLGVVTGMIFTAVYANGNDGWLFDYHDALLQGLLGFLMMRLMRRLVVLHFRFYKRRTDKSELFGQSDLALLNLELSNLLSRDPIEVDDSAIENEIRGRKILVTGAAGSIGSELVKTIARYVPAEIIAIDMAETPLHALILEMKRDFPQIKFSPYLTDIRDFKSLERVVSDKIPEIYFHAAAYKHVSMMEEDPVAAVMNNVKGSMNIADLAIKYNAYKFILISSDKAVNPVGVMGCSKRICEIYCRLLHHNNPEGCKFIITRFGNVLGSNGSVVPIFCEQIRRGGPLTVTSPDVIRYFMLVSEACRLVLEASALGKGDEIFLFDMGKPVKILDLAKKMIKISGKSNIEIKFTGLLQGEKLYEEVLTKAERVKYSINDKLKIAHPVFIDFENVGTKLDLLVRAAESGNSESVLCLMHEIVPEFRHKDNLDLFIKIKKDDSDRALAMEAI